MKNTLPFFLLFPLGLFCQNSTIDSKFILSFECKSKLDKPSSVNNNPESLPFIENEELSFSGAITLNYQLQPAIGLEIGYTIERYVKGIAMSLGGGTGFVYAEPSVYLISHQVPVRVHYSGLYTHLFKRKLIFEPAIGITTALRINDGDIGGDGIGTLTGGNLSLTDNDRKGIEYDVHRVFFLFDTRGQIRYEFTKSFAWFVGGGYSLGTNVIGRINATYTRTTSPAPQFIFKEYRGNNIYLNTGFRIALRAMR